MVRTTGRHSICHLALSVSALILAGLLPGFLSGCGTDESELTREPTISSDGESVVTVKRSGDQLYVEQDGRRVGQDYELISSTTVTEAGDLVFGAKRGDKWVVMRGNERVGDEYDYVAGVTVNSAGEVAFIAKTGDKWQVIRDGKPVGSPHESVDRPVFCPDGESLVYMVVEDNRTFLVRDGVRQPGEFDWAQTPRFSPDGESVVFVVGVDERRQALMKNDTRITPPQEGRIQAWTLAPCGEKAAWVLERDFIRFLFRDGEKVLGPLERYAGLAGPVFGPDAHTVFFAMAQEGRGWTIYRNDQTFADGIEATDLDDLLVSPDGNSVVCAARRGGLWYLLKDGQAVSDGFHRISNLRNGPDGTTFLFAGVLGSTVTEVEIEW